MTASERGERPRRGRWRSGERSRQRILAAAQTGFGRQGFDRTTMRGIAAEAGVDPAEIHYFFRTKEQLFAAAMKPEEEAARRIGELLDQGLDQFGPRLLAHLLRRWDEAADFEPLLALLRSAPTHQGSAVMIRDLVHQQIGAWLAEKLGVSDVELRLGLFSTQLIGLLQSRYVLRTEPIASADRETLVRWLGPVLQGYLTGPAPSS